MDQGDILGDELPSLKVVESPLKAAVYRRTDNEGREIWGVHGPAVPPAGGFRWRSHEPGHTALAHGHVGRAIVLSHECEIENDPNVLILALIRPLTDLSTSARDRQTGLIFNPREKARSGETESTFYLPPDPEYGIDESFVDLRRLTAFQPDAVGVFTRLARLSEVLRGALAEQFWDYLFRPEEQRAGGAGQ